MKHPRYNFPFLSLLACAAVVGTTACASAPRVPTDAEIEAQYIPVEGGILVDDGVRIDAEDGSFSIVTGRFRSPFQMRMAPIRWTNIFSPETFQGTAHRTALVSAWTDALARGAQKVRVTIPGLEAPLYGVIQFNKAHQTATGPASRAYRITIPQTYIEQASNARVSVVYETMSRSDRRRQYAWVLWLSDFPAF